MVLHYGHHLRGNLAWEHRRAPPQQVHSDTKGYWTAMTSGALQTSTACDLR